MSRLLLVLMFSVFSANAVAQPAVDAFSKCLADSTTGKDRKTLARWLFVSMGAHPELKAIAKIAPSAPEDSSREAGALFTRLITDTCVEQAKAAGRAAGPVAFQSAFSVLGQLAMQELMSDKDVAANMALLQKHVDAPKIQAVMSSN
ncbi:hypothetical protein [Ideonella sp.]|uniref:hypothetical protein n=1 Tax=Ideonella sp. TaxID=1929293 RepID=UPI003BB702AD